MCCFMCSLQLQQDILSIFFPHFRLKLYANVQDQLLVNVNKSLWEVMRTCSDEEVTLYEEIMLFLA